MRGLSWQGSAACRGLDVDLFFNDRGESVAEAKAVCARCPVLEPCRAYALSDALLPGIWGGTTFKDRKRIRRKAG